MAFPDTCIGIQANIDGNGDIPVLKTSTGKKITLNITLTETNCPNASAVDFSVLGVTTITFIAKETKDATQTYIEKAATITDSENGGLQISFTTTSLPYAGVWYSGFIGKDSSGDTIFTAKAWLYVEKAIDHSIQTNTPLSIVEVRGFLMDKCASDNYLLDDVEFSDADIMSAIVSPVSEWNETPPNIDSFTPATFPYRHFWKIAASSYLLKSAAFNYTRNNLRYNAGGASIDDKNKAAEYIQLSRLLQEEWQKWLKNKKSELNYNRCYGGIGSSDFYG